MLIAGSSRLPTWLMLSHLPALPWRPTASTDAFTIIVAQSSSYLFGSLYVALAQQLHVCKALTVGALYIW